MSRDYRQIQCILDAARDINGGSQALKERLSPSFDQKKPHVPGGTKITEEALNKRWALIGDHPEQRAQLQGSYSADDLALYQHNIENFIGVCRMPVGLAGPLQVNGVHAKGCFYVPLATTEAALVASYSRGAYLISKSGGCTSVLLSEGVLRAPGFAFNNLYDVGLFVQWCLDRLEQFKELAAGTTRHGRLQNMKVNVEGNHVYLVLEYTTGDASGQNMVTVASQAIFDYILEHSPIKPNHAFIEANFSGDKKASTQSFSEVRGKKVSAEVVIPERLIRKILHTDLETMLRYWTLTALGGVMSGTIGVHGHYANGLAAMYLACGQDVACVAESAVGVTRMEATSEGDLYASVTLPNLMFGSVGGGTGLPTQNACLQMLKEQGAEHAQGLAEVAAGLALAGELSIHGAMCANQFTRAHQKLARTKKVQHDTACAAAAN